MPPPGDPSQGGQPQLMQDPQTGLLVDPASGQMFDPATGQPVDPSQLQGDPSQGDPSQQAPPPLTMEDITGVVGEAADKTSKEVAGVKDDIQSLRKEISRSTDRSNETAKRLDEFLDAVEQTSAQQGMQPL